MSKIVVFIDVREINEWKSGHIPGAIHWPLSRIEQQYIPVFESEKHYIFYCQHGVRSAYVLKLLNHLGFKGHEHLIGGLENWTGTLSKNE